MIPTTPDASPAFGRRAALTWLAACANPALAAAPAAQGSVRQLLLKDVPASATAQQSTMLAAARAGRRIVAVGDNGVVLLSDDDGRGFRQARRVPARLTLTGLSFADERQGWAVGHGGVILHTADGGETWAVQRSDLEVDQPLFSVHMRNAREGVAVGLWSLILRTTDGGASWNVVAPPKPPEGGKADRNLLRVFASRAGTLLVSAEQGTVLRSSDGGASWQYSATGFRGSLWCGAALDDGSVLVAGLRGALYRSGDDGRSWSALVSGVKNSITDLVPRGAGVLGVGLDGLVLASPAPAGTDFTAHQRADRLPLTALVLNAPGEAVAFGKRGPLPPGDPSKA